MGRYTEYLVIGRRLPTEQEAEPPLFRMRIFAPNTTVAKSRFFYFLRQLRKMKSATSEIVAIHAVSICLLGSTSCKVGQSLAQSFGTNANLGWIAEGGQHFLGQGLEAYSDGEIEGSGRAQLLGAGYQRESSRVHMEGQADCKGVS